MTTFMSKLGSKAAALVVVGLLTTQDASAGQFGRALRTLGAGQGASQVIASDNKQTVTQRKLTNSGIIVAGGKDSTIRKGIRLGDSLSLNPQPLPSKTGGFKAGKFGDSVSLNPQPLPPKMSKLNAGRLGDAVSLNPQPLPPKVKRRLWKGLNDPSQVIAAPNGNTGISGIGLPQSSKVFSKPSRVISAPSGNTGINGTVLSKRWQKSPVIAAPNGNTGITGAGLPVGSAARMSNAARAGAPVQPQQLMSFGLPGIVVAGAAKELLPSVGEIGEAALKEIGNIGNNKLPPSPPKSQFEGKITAEANVTPTLGKRKIGTSAAQRLGQQVDPNASLGKKKLPGTSSTSSIPSLPGGLGSAGSGGNGGASNGNAGGGPLPTAPAPQNPTIPAPAPQNPGTGGFPWQELVVGAALNQANRQQVVEVPVYASNHAAPLVQEGKMPAPTTAVEPQPTPVAQGAADLVLEDVQRVEPATLLVGPAYRVKFRNQSPHAVGAFHAAIFAGIDGKLSDDAPRAVVEIAGMQGSEVMEVTLRLPATAMKLVSAKPNQPAGFSHLFVAVDETDSIAELDEDNNTAVIETAALEAIAAK